MKSFCSFLVIEPIILVFEIKFNNNNGFDPRKPMRKKPIDPIYKKGA